VIALAVALLAGCTYSHEEPGLLGRSSVSLPTAAPPERQQRSQDPRPRTNPALPVVGEAVWTSADGLDIQVRIAVHAVRRIAGGTMLDWSVTPLRGPGLGPDDVVPAALNLGLSREGGATTNVLLLAGGKVYRPLTRSGPQGSGCWCTPIWLAQRYLRIGQTTLLQIAFPELPADLALVDVDIATITPFSGVPITPAGFVPLASSPTDLTRPAQVIPDLGSIRKFTYAPTGQRFAIAIQEVSASANLTSISWTVESLTDGAGLEGVRLPPFADRSPTFNQVAASGPRITLRNPTYRARLMTTSGAELECLCSDLRVWAAALRSAGHKASLVTNLPALPRGTHTVTITLPGLPPLSGIPVSEASDSTLRSAGPVRTPVRTWTRGTDRALGAWPDTAWPTPVPTRSDLRHNHIEIDELVR
jgi:hypothetical protein